MVPISLHDLQAAKRLLNAPANASVHLVSLMTCNPLKRPGGGYGTLSMLKVGRHLHVKAVGAPMRRSALGPELTYFYQDKRFPSHRIIRNEEVRSKCRVPLEGSSLPVATRSAAFASLDGLVARLRSIGVQTPRSSLISDPSDAGDGWWRLRCVAFWCRPAYDRSQSTPCLHVA